MGTQTQKVTFPKCGFSKKNQKLDICSLVALQRDANVVWDWCAEFRDSDNLLFISVVFFISTIVSLLSSILNRMALLTTLTVLYLSRYTRKT